MAAAITLGLDIGTQGVKGLAVAVDGDSAAVIARASLPLELIPGLPPGAAEQHPDDWWESTVAVIGELLRHRKVDPLRVRGIGVSGQQHGSVFLDGDDRPLRTAQLWCDTTTVSEARELSEQLGRAIPVGYTASKVRAFAKSDPESWARCTGVLLPHDFIGLRLTGRRCTEAGDASGTGYFDPSTRDWDSAAITATAPGLAKRLPEVIPPGTIAGTLTPAAAEALHLSPDVIVAPGGGDNMMSAIGSGATRPGVVTMSLGTSGTVFTRTDTPVVDPEGLIAPFCSSDGAWLPLLCVMNCTNVTEEVRAAFDDGREEFLEELTAAAGSVEAGCGGLTFIPFLQGERVPDLPDAAGTLTGIVPGSLRPGTLFRAALEGVTCNLALGVERLKRLGVTVDEVRLVGGGSNNPLWRTLVADLLDARVTLPEEPESAAFGAALQAWWVDRRRTEPTLSCDAATHSAVRLRAETIFPDPERRAALLPVLERFRERLSVQ